VAACLAFYALKRTADEGKGQMIRTRIIAALGVAGTLASNGALSQDTEATVYRIAASDPLKTYQTQIQEAERLGRRIYEHDRAALVATDFLFENLDGKIAKGVVGWIEEEISEESIRVFFYNIDNNVFRPAYSVDVKRGKLIESSYVEYPKSAEFTPTQLLIAKARDLGARQKFAACSQNYNTVVFPNENGGYYVYVLAATFLPGVVVIGGHYRFEIDAAAEQVVETRKFTNSCIALNKNATPEGAQPVALMVSHVLTPYPTEIHAFVSLQHDMPIYVMTVDNKTIWSVEKGKFRSVKNF